VEWPSNAGDREAIVLWGRFMTPRAVVKENRRAAFKREPKRACVRREEGQRSIYSMSKKNDHWIHVRVGVQTALGGEDRGGGGTCRAGRRNTQAHSNGVPGSPNFGGGWRKDD